jgi:hypothetical protein
MEGDRTARVASRLRSPGRGSVALASSHWMDVVGATGSAVEVQPHADWAV